MRIVERVGHFGRYPQGVVDRELLLAIQPVAQRLTSDERHHARHRAIALTRVGECEDVRVLEVGRRPDLRQEARPADHRGQLSSKDPQRNPAIVPDVVREIHGGHAAGA